VGRLESGVSVNSEDVATSSSHEYGILKTSCIANGYFFSQENKKIIPSEIARAKLNPTEDSILVSRMNTPQLVGEVGYVSKSYPNLFIPDRLWLIEVKNKSRDSTKWLCQQLTTKYLKNVLTNIATGTSGSMKNIAQPNFLSIELSTPEFAEQTKIANFLTAVDEKIAQLTQKGDLLARYKKGVMQQIFSQQLRFKDDAGQEFSDWEDSKLTDVATIVGGGTPDTTVKKYWNGEIQWFTPTELKTKYMSKSLRTITESGLKNSSAKILPVGTLLFSSRATVGDISIALNECTTNQGFQSFIVNNENCNKFVYYWILNNKNVFLEKASGSTFLEISKKEIEKLKIKNPSILEQTKIANFLTAIDDKISHNQTQLNAMKQYKQGLLQQLFV